MPSPTKRLLAALFALPVALVFHSTALADDDDDDDDDDDFWEDLADDLEDRYENVEDAIAEGFFEASECVEQPGVGAMGHHYVNPDLIDGVLDPYEPEILLYLPDSEGNLVLVGVEYGYPTGPFGELTLFGQDFHTNPHTGLDDLHVWLLEDYSNPAGLFAPFNSALACDGTGLDDDDRDDDDDDDDDED
jgi:hypothetical protein